MKPALRLFFAFSIGCTLSTSAAEPSAIQARILAREGHTAREAQNFPVFLRKMEEAVALRPDYPRLLVNLAEAQVANERLDDAVATLARLAALGTHSPVDKTAAFSPLRERPDFKAVVTRLEANLLPVGSGEIAFSLPGMTGLIEGIAWREKTREFFFGDVHHRAVWVRASDGKVRRFSAADEAVTGVFGLVVDEARGTLWAAVSGVPAMSGADAKVKDSAGIAEFDLQTGELRGVKRIASDGYPHALGDLALAADGSVFATDSLAPILWRLAPQAPAPTPFVESSEFVSLQGLTFSADGSTLYLADHSSGLLRLDLSTRKVSQIDSPPDSTLIGIDGLVLAPNGDLIAVQNGVRPMRVLQLELAPGGDGIARVAVLESGHLTMAAPALGCISNGDFFFIGNSGWSRFEEMEPKPTAPRPVPVFRTKIQTAAPAAKKR